MCGIIYTKRFDGMTAWTMTIKRYEAQKNRGQEGFGFVALKGGFITAFERTEEEKDIRKGLLEAKEDEILFHHRFPTSTPNFKEASHPIWVSHPSLKYDYYVIHNGVITNDHIWKTKHEALGYKYTTELTQEWKQGTRKVSIYTCWNDSEALAIELARSLDTEGKGVDVSGSIAFMALQADKTTGKAINMYWGHNSGSPLKAKMQKGQFLHVASEGDGKFVELHKLWSLNYETLQVKDRDFICGVWDYPSKKGSRDELNEGTGGIDSPYSDEDDEELETYIDLCDEHDEIMAILNHTNPTVEEEVEMRDRLKIITRKLEDYDTKYAESSSLMQG